MPLRLRRGGPPVSEDEYQETLREVEFRALMQRAAFLGSSERVIRQVQEAEKAIDGCCLAIHAMWRKSVDALTPDQRDRYNDLVIDGMDEWDALVQIEEETSPA